MTIEELFREALIEDFANPTFLRLLNDGVEIDYNEATSRTHNDSLISDPYKSYAFGQDRYFLTQSKFYESARAGKLDVRVVSCLSNGYPIAHLRFGRFLATYHFGKSPNKITCPQTSLVRQQHASLNKEMISPKLPGLGDSEPVLNAETFKSADQVYINIIHGCGGRGRDFTAGGFLRIAIPYFEKTVDARTKKERRKFGFLANVDLRDILRVLVERESSQSAVTPIADVAIPRVKKVVGDNG